MLPYKFRQRKVKKTDRQKLIAKLDTVFSEFIRLRDSNGEGICKCITCGNYYHWTDMDAGHFITRDNMATRWEEENVHAQCRQDNRFLSGKQYEHGLAVDKRHGPGTASKLLIKSKSVCNWQDYEIEAMIAYYKSAVRELKAVKGMV